MPAVSQENGQHILFAKDHEPGLYQNYLKAIEEGRADQAKKKKSTLITQRPQLGIA